MENNDFDFKTLPIEAQDEEIRESDFKLVDNSKRVHEQKFQTKPTTFFRDSLKRFSKNKSSVVAAGILGTLLLLSFFVPLFSGGANNDNSQQYAYRAYLEPKLFNAGTGFWDGTKKWTSIAVDVNGHPDATTEAEKQEFWWPSPEDFKQQAVSNKTFTDMVYTSDKSTYAHGGYVQFGISGETDKKEAEMYANTFNNLDINGGDIYLENFNVYDLNRLKAEEGEKAFFPDNYVQGTVSFEFKYYFENEYKRIVLLDKASTFTVSSLNLSDIIRADSFVTEKGITNFEDATFSLFIDKDKENRNSCVLIKNLEFKTENAIKETLEASNFTDANEFQLRSYDDVENRTKYWYFTGISKKLHMAQVIYCDFVYDSYEAVFGTMEIEPERPVTASDMTRYKNNGWCEWDYRWERDQITGELVITYKHFKVLDEKCPVKDVTNVTINQDAEIKIYGTVEYYRYHGFNSMPRFLAGTDKGGHDMFKYVFEGLRTSLLLGIISFAICFIIGLIYGSISGYFGGTTDLIMERFTDILSGLPWIVVMTLVILHLGQNVVTFGLAICLTSWIGTASLTRTQFYRFRGREYVLASRSLGASDARLIARHILPNAMGTLITSEVLMIPSIIFSEATISYLGLGLKGTSSLGVILSENQTQLTIHPYLLIFPAVVIALLMISFNLFGNGLRDAVNPSLKGEEQ